MSKVVISNAATGETVEREMTVDEQAKRDAENAEWEALQQAKADAEAAKEAARQSAIDKLAALGLSVDEIRAAFGLEGN